MGIAIGWFACHGWTVCVPLTDSQPYDLVVDQGFGLRRVAVRTSTQRGPNGAYEVGLRTQGGNYTQKSKVRLFDPTIVDLLFVALDDGNSYLIPAVEIACKASITVGGRKYQQFHVDVVSTASTSVFQTEGEGSTPSVHSQ